MRAGPLRFFLAVAVLCAVLGMPRAQIRAEDTAENLDGIVETLVLKNGDRVAGSSTGVSDGQLRWKMPYGGKLSIPLALVDRIEQTSAKRVTPAAAVELPPAPPEVPPVVEVETVEEPEPPEKPKTDKAVEAAVAEEVPPVVSEPLPLTTAWYEAGRSTYTFSADQTSKWTKRFELGGTWVDGNSETSEAYIGGQFERQFERVSHQLTWNGRHSTAGEKITQSRWQFNGNTDFSKKSDSKWILFLSHNHLFDRLADLDYRGTFAGGVGYRFFNEGDKRLITRLGPGATVEKYAEPVGTRVTPDLFAEAEAKWPVFDRTILEYKSTWTPSMNDIAIFRMTSNYGVLVKLDQKESWAMRVGLRHDHNSEPAAKRKKDDFTTTFSVVYTRK